MAPSLAISHSFSLPQTVTVVYVVPILDRNQPPPASVHCVREVRVGIPRQRLDDVLRFYGTLLGLQPWPPERQIPCGYGVGNPHCGLFFEFRHDPQVDPIARRFTLIIPDMNRIEKRLQQQEWHYQKLHGIDLSNQCLLVHDPVGHLIELRESQPM